jgi:hypothetical protein
LGLGQPRAVPTGVIIVFMILGVLSGIYYLIRRHYR